MTSPPNPSTHLRALLADAERDLARHSHAERLTAAVVRRRDWRDRLLTDVLRGQEETRDAIKRIADERGVPMSRVVEDAIAALVAQGKP